MESAALGGESEDSAFIVNSEESGDNPGSTNVSNGLHKKRSAAELQKKLERCIEQAKKNQPVVDQPSKKNTGIIPINRLSVPNKSSSSSHVRKDSDSEIRTPLVLWESETSDDEYDFQPAVAEIKMNVNKDGKPENFVSKASYTRKRLESFDISPDEEDDLDLIPPRPYNERSLCCPIGLGYNNWCSLQ